jgi:hypothetical protein
MIEYVHVQLSVWGRWTLRKTTSGLGFPSVSPMFIGARFSGAYGSHPPIGIEVCGEDHVHDTDAAVDRLSVEKKRLCVEYYVIGGKGCDVASRLGIAKRTLYDRIDSLHADMLCNLNDVVAGC